MIGKTTKAPKVARDSVAKVEEWVEEGWQRLVETYPASHWERVAAAVATASSASLSGRAQGQGRPRLLLHHC